MMGYRPLLAESFFILCTNTILNEDLAWLGDFEYNISQPFFDSVEHARSSYTDTIGVSTLGHMVEQ